MIKIIVAMGRNNEIGIGDQLLGKFPEDLKHFRFTTRGQIVVFGRKTFDGLPEQMKDFPSRYGVILTSDPTGIARYIGRNAGWSTSLIKLVTQYNELPEDLKKTDMYICGGEKVYRDAIEMPEVSELIITHIDRDFPEATHFFPAIDFSTWHEVESWSLTDELQVIRYKRK